MIWSDVGHESACVCYVEAVDGEIESEGEGESEKKKKKNENEEEVAEDGEGGVEGLHERRHATTVVALRAVKGGSDYARQPRVVGGSEEARGRTVDAREAPLSSATAAVAQSLVDASLYLRAAPAASEGEVAADDASWW